MKQSVRWGILLLLAFSAHTTYAQVEECEKITNKKAQKLVDQAIKEYTDTRNIAAAKALIDKSLNLEPSNAEAYYVLGKMAFEQRDYATMETAYGNAVNLCPGIAPEPHFELGKSFFYSKDYAKALVSFSTYLKFPKINAQNKKEAELLKTKCQFITDLLDNPVPFEPSPVAGICTKEDEYLPIISPDGELCFFTRKMEKSGKGMLTARIVEEFSYSELKNGNFDAGQKMLPPFNTTDNEGGATITIDNKDLYFTICKKEDGGMNCDIYTSHFEKGKWGKISNMGPNVNDPKNWDSQPSVSSDGRSIYFSSARPGGYGEVDIWMTQKDSMGVWGKATNLGPSINTGGNEKSPFIHTDSHTLYFCSDSLPGLGGFDLFFSRQNADGAWDTPKNLGHPINTDADELGFFVSTNGLNGYFASNKLKGVGGWDLYSFSLYKEARPERVLFIKGDVKDPVTGKPTDAQIELRNTYTNEKYKVKVDSITGKYVTAVKFDEDYVISIKKKGFATESKFLAVNELANRQPMRLDWKPQELKVGKTFPLNDINFSTNAYNLNDTSKAIINEFIEFLKENPTVKIAINGHTDNINDNSSNLILSENRAKSVYEYVIQQGIDKNRLSYKGFGESQPIASNDKPEGRAKNRRTEFLIIEK
jgi:outer membrane protein OmpA-like peptidoglycan-associated protein